MQNVSGGAWRERRDFSGLKERREAVSSLWPFLAFHYDVIIVCTQGYIISLIWQIHQRFRRHLESLVLEMTMRNILSYSLEKQLRPLSIFFFFSGDLGVFLIAQDIASYNGHSKEKNRQWIIKCLFFLYVFQSYHIKSLSPLVSLYCCVMVTV